MIGSIFAGLHIDRTSFGFPARFPIDRHRRHIAWPQFKKQNAISCNSNSNSNSNRTVMSLYSAVEAVKLAEKAKEKRRAKLEAAIDADVQKLKTTANQCMTDLPDGEGYYTFEITASEISYEKPKVVIDRFCQDMEKLGFVVPTIKFKRNRLLGLMSSSNDVYLIRFRPSEEAIKMASTLLDDEASYISQSSPSHSTEGSRNR